MTESIFFGSHPYALMHLPFHQRKKFNSKDFSMTNPAVFGTSFINLPPTVFEEEPENFTSKAPSSNGASTSPLIMKDFPDRMHKFPNPNLSHGFLPNGDLIFPSDRFRSLNRPKLGINAIAGPFSNSNFMPKKFSKSEWDLHHHDPNHHPVNGYIPSSSGTSIVESAEQTEQGSEHSEEQAGVFRRHHGHYFSNADLFSQQNPGFNYLKYAKAEDFEIVNNGSPHVRILDFSFELDPRSNFAKIMLQSNPSYQILHNLNFDLHGGDTLALMYTSEPEIHCFLSILTGHNPPNGKIHGVLEINGHSLKSQQFAERSAFVSLKNPPKWLTVVQYLNFYTCLIQPATNAVPRRRLIEQMIHGLALGPLRNRLIKELSWTEKQRMKLASQMILDTDILITENIIQEMDIYDAAFVVDFIRDWAQRFNRIVIMAVNPPTIEILTMFRKAAIMSSGRLVYFGESSGMRNYFESIGFPCPNLKSPCDYYVDLVTHDLLTPDSALESSARIRTLADLWNHKRPIPSMSQPSIVSPKLIKPSVFYKIWILYIRFLSIFFNRPWPRLSEFFFATIFSLLLGWIFFDIPRDRRSGIDDRQGFLFSLNCLMPFLLGLFSMQRVYEDQKMLNYDYSSNLFSVGSYFFSKIMFDLPFAIFSAMILTTPAYFLSYLNPILESSLTGLISFTIPIVMATVILRYTSWIFAYFFKSKILATTFFGFVNLLNLLFSGFLIHADDQWKPFGLNFQIFNPNYWFRKELYQIVFLTGNGSTVFETLEGIFESIKFHPDLIIDCLRQPVVARKLAVPILTVKKCLKTTGKQLFSFEGYNNSIDESYFGWMIIGCWFSICIFSLVLIMICCSRKFVKNEQK